MLAAYREVLGVRGAARLYASALVARLPQGMSSLATLLLVRGATHSYAAAGAAVGAEALTTAAAAPPLGRLIDRVGRRTVLPPCALAYCAASCLLVAAAELHAGAAALVLLSGLAGALLPPIAPTLRALMRYVFTGGAVRERAYALESITQELIWITGPLLVAALVTAFSPAVAVVLLGVAAVLGTSLFVRSPLVRAGGEGGQAPRGGAALASRPLRLLLAPVALNGVALGATEVGLPALALHSGSRSATGLLLALWSLGSLTGGLWYGARGWRASLATRYAALLMVGIGCTAPLIAADSLPAGLAAAFLAGVAIAPVFSCQYALVGRAVAPGTETEAFTWASSALVAGLAAGSAAAGALVSAAGVHAAFVLACGAGAVAALLAFGARALLQRHLGVAAEVAVER